MENKSNNFESRSPIQCEKLNYLAYFFIILLIFSVFLNTFLLYIFYKCPKLHAPTNFYMITITLFNLIGTIIVFPFQIISNLNCKWVNFRILHRLYTSGSEFYTVHEILHHAFFEYRLTCFSYKHLPYRCQNMTVLCSNLFLGTFPLKLEYFSYNLSENRDSSRLRSENCLFFKNRPFPVFHYLHYCND